MLSGYLTIVMLMMVMSFYLIYRLNYLNKVTDSIMRSDIPFIENGEKLVDCFLEQVRNEKKYLITNDNAFRDLFDQKKKEFLERLKYLEESIADRGESGGIQQTKELYKKYLSLVSKEIVLMGQNEAVSSDTRYKEEKKKTLDQLTESIHKLILVTQTELIKKIELLQKVGYRSTDVPCHYPVCCSVWSGFRLLFHPEHMLSYKNSQGCDRAYRSWGFKSSD
ncbi:MAG: two-component sensor kinase [Candidatus Brocadia fulgida]|uniref:Two-component sensor kinase n=1 Tax=Candidatus Brocadia fulgida TaxID=380242 RepID=A0A0M2UW86_9BACT|nr:MAG: two-component sensor kinase [Candidatus Brocadia fulgida]